MRRMWLSFLLFLSTAGYPAEELEVHFVDVGQGDCTLVKCPDGRNILVDCGSLLGGDEDRVRDYLLNELGEPPELEALVITHPDKDHYNFLPTVLEGVQIDRILLTDWNNQYPEAGLDRWLRKFSSVKKRLLSTEFDTQDAPSDLFGEGDTHFFVLAANTYATDSPTNAKSIVLKVSYEGFDVLLTGDATFDTEKKIMERYEAEWLDVEVLKIGHHGSLTTSTSIAWVKATTPEVAVVSCGYSNTFAHPRKEVIQRLEPSTCNQITGHKFRWGFKVSGDRKARFKNFPDYQEAIYSTATNGNIVVTSDGEEFEIQYEGTVDHPCRGNNG